MSNRYAVLIVEDNPDISTQLGDYLSDKGFIVDFASNGKTAFDYALKNLRRADPLVVALEFEGQLDEANYQYVQHDGCSSRGGDVHKETMTVAEAKKKAATLPECHGFCFRGEDHGAAVEIMFKNKFDVTVGQNKWTSFQKKGA